jgi:putative tricarboxylic transport membrane protein
MQGKEEGRSRKAEVAEKRSREERKIKGKAKSSCHPQWRAVGFRTGAALAALVTAMSVVANAATAAEWKPEKPVEIVALNAPGGGSDRIARIFIKILQERRLVQVPVSVVNRPGGGGAVGYNYINQRPGDGHVLALGGRAILTNHVAGVGPSYTDVTPVVTLFDEYISVTVKTVSPIRSGKQLIEFMKRDPNAMTFGIATSLGNPNHQAVAAAFKIAGLDPKKMKNVIFASGGAATTAMLGGHIDVVPISVAFGASLMRNGQVRAIAVTSPKRLSGVFTDVPTWREQGYDVVVSTWRSLFGPKGMTAAQLAYWETVVQRVLETEEWKQELELNLWNSAYKGSAETRKYLAQDNEGVKAFLAELGLAR